MSRFRSLLIAGLVVSALPAASAQAGVRIGIGIGFPICWGGPCYYPAPVYYVPGPYCVTAPAVVVQQPVVSQPAMQQPAPRQEETAPPPKPVQPQAAAQPQPLPEAVVLKPVMATRPGPQGEVDQYVGRLADADEGVRLDAVTRLGRMRAAQAGEPLAATLAGDQSPAVREAAARSLAILSDPKALPALLRAAEGDTDRDVRRAARFAVDVIQTR